MSLEALWYRRTSGLSAALMALPLAPASWLYGLAVRTRAAAWSLNFMRPARVEGLKVVSVGNVVVGGSGKTPIVIFLCQWAMSAGHRVAVITRGYGRREHAPVRFNGSALQPVEASGDEARLIARACPGVEVFVDADRVRAARAAAAAGFTWAVLDDGFQHRRLHRDVDLVVDHSSHTGHLLPWGPLREPRSALGRATLRWGEGGDVVSRTSICAVQGPAGQTELPQWLAGRPVVALAAIARPWRFTESLEAAGARVVDLVSARDHAFFDLETLERARTLARSTGAVIVTTAKDQERLPPGFEAWTARLSLEVTQGRERLAGVLGLPLQKLPR